jgi:hypothetical protein
LLVLLQNVGLGLYKACVSRHIIHDLRAGFHLFDKIVSVAQNERVGSEFNLSPFYF